MGALNPYAIIGAILFYVASVGYAGWKGYDLGYSEADAMHIAANQKADEEARAAKERADRAAKEREEKWAKAKEALENENAEKEKRIAGLRLANGRLVAAAGGLYDKNGRPNPAGGNSLPGDPNAAGQLAGTAAGCGLSEKVTSDLLDLARDADVAANYAATCKAWIDTLR